jgi:hypothetical protein
VFLKANADLRDPIFGVRFADGAQWGGLGAAYRELREPVTARVRHETLTGFFSLAQCDADIPEDVNEKAALFGSFPPKMQCSAAAFDADYDAILLSIQADVVATPALHVRSGLRFVLNDERNWPEATAAWRREAFRNVGVVTVEQSMDDLRRVVQRLRQTSNAPILVANMSATIRGETVHSYLGMPEILSHRIRRFNLALIDVAHDLDISVLDIERIIAQGGAETLMIDHTHFTLEGCRRIALETARILDDCGMIGAL